MGTTPLLADAGTRAFGTLSEGLKRMLGHPWLPAVLNMAALLLLASTMAHWTWRILEPPASRVIPQVAGPARSDAESFNLQALLAAKLFGEALPATTPVTRPVEYIPASDLDLILVGVVAAGPDSLALIRVNDDPETPFGIGDEITYGVTLRAVYPDRVLIQRRGATEALLLEDAAASLDENAVVITPSAGRSGTGIRAHDDRSFTVDRELVQSELRNPDVFRQALLVPNAGGGFLVREIQPGSIYEKLGLKVGDVIRKVNGRPLDSIDEALKLYQQLGGIDQVTDVRLEVMRAGRLERLQYRVR